MTNLINFRTMLDNILGAAVDSATWTNTIKDEALRQALLEYDDYFIYETDFTVTSTGYAQDLSAITSLKEVINVAYPWSTGADFAEMARSWRYTDDQTIYFETIEPQSGDTIRVRYTKLHTIEDLDAAATLVPARHHRIVTVAAAIYCIETRIRQLSENPATPKTSVISLHRYLDRLSGELAHRLATVRHNTAIVWSEIGL